MALLFILSFAFLGISVQANKGFGTTFQKNMSFRRHRVDNRENGIEKEQIITSAKDLLVELGNNTKRIIEESIYNETEGVEICWKNILYVNESVHLNESDGETIHWQEYQVVFDFPAGDIQLKDEPNKEYKKYKIQAEDKHTHLLDFELVYSHPNYTISKYENVTCGKGSFLSKTYYEWPKMDKKRLVVRLTNDYTQFVRKGDGFMDQNQGSDEDVIVGSPRDDLESTIESTTVSVPQIDKAKATEGTIASTNIAEEGTEDQSHDEKFVKDQNASKPEDPVVRSPYPYFKKSLNDKIVSRKKNSSKLEPVAKENSTSPDQSIEFSSEDVEIPKNMVNSTSPNDNPGSVCSPFITQLVSGNSLFQGLCKLKKDEKVVLQGDILVSKKYVDEKNREVMQPLFVIHENTEIEGSMDEVEETTTDAVEE